MWRRSVLMVLASAFILAFGACQKKEEAPGPATEAPAAGVVADTAAAVTDTAAAAAQQTPAPPAGQ